MTHHCILPATILLALTALSPATAQADAQDARGLKIISISDLLFRTQPPRAPRLGKLSGRRRGDENFPRPLAKSEFFCIEKGQFLDLIRSTCGDVADEVSMIVRGQSLLISGKNSHVAEVEQIVKVMRRAMTQRFAVNVRLYRIGTDQYPAAASARQLTELTKDLTPIWHGHTKTLSGQQVVLAQENFTRYVCDVDVEVAEEISVGQPVTTSMFEGIRILVESHALIGSTDRVFKCQFALCEKQKELKLQSTGVQDMPSIGIPHLAAISGAFSGRVEHDGALLVSIKSRAPADGNFLLVVQASPSAANPTEISAGETLLLPISALTSSSLQFDMPLTRSEEDPEGARGGYPVIKFEVDDGGNRGETLLSLLRESLGSLLDEGGAAVDMTSNGSGHGFILVRGSQKTRTEVRRLLAALHDQWIHGVEVQLTTELLAVPRGSSTFSALSQVNPSSREVLHSLTFPTLIGDTALVFKGIESAVVRDYEPEIANKTTLSNPAVQTTFRGLAVAVRPTVQGKTNGANLYVEISHIPTPTRQSTAQDSVGDLYHVNVNTAQFTRSGAVKLETKVPLGWGPLFPGEPNHLRVHQSVRFRKL